MKNFKFIIAAVLMAAAVSCSKANVSGVVRDADGKLLQVKVLGIGKYDRIDTVSIGKGGRFSFRVDIKKGQPEFVYLAYNDRNIASLILESGDKVTVETDSLGVDCKVAGSEESVRLMEVEKEYAAFLNGLLVCTDRVEYVRRYVAHYRKCVEYVINNSKSLTAIPVLHEKITNFAPVFAQTTDAIHFRTVCDSLKTVYPESIYVKALDEEADRMARSLLLQDAIRNAKTSGFPDLNLPDMKGQLSRLSDIDSNVILLHFWDSSDPVQKMMNVEILAPIYKDYHNRGFEIYSVDVNPDKVTWGTVVRSQNLQWVNVNDGKGASSSSLATYNVRQLPNSILIAGGDVVSGDIKGAEGLRKEIEKRL